MAKHSGNPEVSRKMGVSALVASRSGPDRSTLGAAGSVALRPKKPRIVGVLKSALVGYITQHSIFCNAVLSRNFI